MALSNKAKQYIRLIREKPYKIGHLLGFPDLTELHNEWMINFMFSDEDYSLLAHRGSYKTTALSIALALMVILFPNTNTIFLRKTDTDVIEIITQVSKMLHSDLMQTIVTEIYGEPMTFRKDSFTEIDTSLNTSSRGTAQLIGIGIGASMTGKHGDRIVTDDIVNVKDRSSKAERERTKAAYMELQNIKNRGGRIINTGTPWHEQDAISIMPNKHVYDCYSTGLITKEEIRDLQSSMTASLFSANYEMKHISDEDTMFKNPQYTDNDLLILQGTAHIDAAYGGSDASVYTIIKEHKGKIYVLGKRWEKHIDDCLPYILQLHKHYQAGLIYSERNADKGYLHKNLIAEGLPSHSYHEKENKIIKISTYLRKHWKDIIFVEGTDPDYVSEILGYNEFSEHDDSPDSLASIIRIVLNKEPQSKDEEIIDALKMYGL